MNRDSKLLIPEDREWMDWVLEIMEEGGSLWVLERTDTNQFMVRGLDFRLHKSGEPFSVHDYEWRDEFPSLHKAEFGNMAYFKTSDLYPTKELAEKFAPKNITEGGCRCCGNDSTNIPTVITEHQFINNKR